MGNELQIVPPQVRRAARRIAAAADQVADVDLAAPLRGVADALPGTPCVGAAGKLRSTWRFDQRDWVRFVRRHSAAMGTAANGLTDTDALNAAEARRLGIDLSMPYTDPDPTTAAIEVPTAAGVG